MGFFRNFAKHAAKDAGHWFFHEGNLAAAEKVEKALQKQEAKRLGKEGKEALKREQIARIEKAKEKAPIRYNVNRSLSFAGRSAKAGAILAGVGLTGLGAGWLVRNIPEWTNTTANAFGRTPEKYTPKGDSHFGAAIIRQGGTVAERRDNHVDADFSGRWKFGDLKANAALKDGRVALVAQVDALANNDPGSANGDRHARMEAHIMYAANGATEIVPATAEKGGVFVMHPANPQKLHQIAFKFSYDGDHGQVNGRGSALDKLNRTFEQAPAQPRQVTPAAIAPGGQPVLPSLTPPPARAEMSGGGMKAELVCRDHKLDLKVAFPYNMAKLVSASFGRDKNHYTGEMPMQRLGADADGHPVFGLTLQGKPKVEANILRLQGKQEMFSPSEGKLPPENAGRAKGFKLSPQAKQVIDNC